VRGEDELIDLLRDTQGMVAAAGEPLNPRVLSRAPSLKVISRPGVGTDDIDIAAATAHGIMVCNTPGANCIAVAEWTFALMLACARRMAANFGEVRRGGWQKHEGMDLAGKTLGIVGLGAIGKEVARRARAFDMRVVTSDHARDRPFTEAAEIARLPLDGLLGESDFVSLHLSGKRCLLDAGRLALMKPGAFLINVARGGVVDAAALYAALKEKRIAGAALDVFEVEPLALDSPLRELDNVYLSPHVAGASRDARRRSGATAAENLIRALGGQPPLHVVNPEVLNR